MGGTIGSHLIVRHDELYTALAGRMIYFGTADGRVNLIYPFMGNVLIGATDIPETDIDGASCSAGERDYMISAVREIFPSIVIHPDQIRMTCCGVRPLPAGGQTEPGAISRDHSVAVDIIPGASTEVLSLIGGKWTTFRGFAEEVADRLLNALAKPRLRRTQELAIGGGAGFPRDEEARARFVTSLAEKTPLSEARAAVLLSRYGTRAQVYGLSLTSDEHLLSSCPSRSVEEIRWICRHEHVVRLTDIVFRRTSIALSGELTDAVITEFAQVVGDEKGWDAAVMREEIASARRAALQQGIRLE
jgi:glycerol-3-phosphate dehydrogenase